MPDNICHVILFDTADCYQGYPVAALTNTTYSTGDVVGIHAGQWDLRTANNHSGFVVYGDGAIANTMMVLRDTGAVNTSDAQTVVIDSRVNTADFTLQIKTRPLSGNWSSNTSDWTTIHTGSNCP